MVKGPRPLPERRTPLQQQQMVSWLSLSAVLFHLGVLVAPVVGAYPPGLTRWPASFGLLGSAVLWWVSRRPDGSSAVRAVTLAIMGVWLVTDLYAGASMRRGVSTWMVLDTELMMLLLFAFLPFRQALLGAIMTYLLFLVAAWQAGNPDPVVLMVVALAGGITVYLVIHGRQISQERLRNEVLRWQVEHDGLTGAVIRHALLEQVNLRLGEQHVVLMIDIDHFKQVNDTYGHLTGDEALRQVVRIMQEQVRERDLVCRWGGEEFVVLLLDMTVEKGLQVAERIRLAVRQSELPGLPPITVSMGVASLAGAESAEAVIAQADAQLYQAKAEGRDRITVA